MCLLLQYMPLKYCLSGGNRGVVHVVRQVAALRGPNHSYIELLAGVYT